MPEISIFNILIVFVWSIFLLWLAGLIWTWICLRKQRPFRFESDRNINSFVSILVPARNEAHRVLEKSISSMLAQTYKNYETIVLNDRSTDETGEILQKIKTENPDSAFQIINGIEPPKNWLGKPHALQQAFEAAKGEWILTTDADIIFSDKTLQTVVNYAENNNLDALTLIPKQLFGSFWEKLFMPVFGWFCVLAMPIHRVNDPNRKESMGVGNFFMFRRDCLKNIGEFEVVKSEVAEDLKLAEIIKKKGLKLRIEYAPDLIETRMYAGFWEIWEGFTKNLFSGMKFSLSKTIFGAFSIFLFGVLPIFGAIFALIFGQIKLFIPLISIYILQVSIFINVHREWKGNIFYALLTPLGLLMFLAILVNSTIKVVSGKGVKWKDRAIYENGGIRPPLD